MSRGGFVGVMPDKAGVENDGAPGITKGETMRLAIDKMVGVPVILSTAPAMTPWVRGAESLGVLLRQLSCETGYEGMIIGMAGCGSRGVDLEEVPEGFEEYDDDIGRAPVEGPGAMTVFGKRAVETTGCCGPVSSLAAAVILAMPGGESTT
jgi:hypothetical protein